MPSDSNSTAAPQPAIVLRDVRKTFQIKHTQSFKETFIASLKRKPLSSDFHALDNVSFEVPEGQSVALMGRNGSGKSTTLKLVSGVMRPDSGWVRTRGRIAGLLEVGAGFHPDLTGRENVYLNAAILGMSKKETDERFDEIVEFSEIGEFIDTEVKFYSSGMYSRLGFSVAVHTNVDVLLVDEVLSVGDAQFREKCNQRMLELQQNGKTMFVVSHSVSDVRRLCQRGIVLEHGRVVFDGPIEEAISRLNRVEQNDLPYPIESPISDLYQKNPNRFGAPQGEQILTSANGGGIYQEFEKGIITSFNSQGKQLTVGLVKGIFLTSYRKQGGPEGAWGFVSGGATGDIVRDETRWMTFSNGVAAYTLDNGMDFYSLEAWEEHTSDW